MSEASGKQGGVRNIASDRPRQALNDDELGYGRFAEAVAASLASRRGLDGLVIAVHGVWGSGKTSAVNMAIDALAKLEAHLADDQRTIVTHFNPWWFSEQTDLTRAFFSELNASIGRRLSAIAGASLRKLAKRASGMTEAASSLLALTPAGIASKFFAEVLKVFGNEISDQDSLEKVRNDLASALAKEARNIVVVIDDIDRLEAKEMRQIFRLVKSVADLPRVTYLLIFDRTIVTNALSRSSELGGPDWMEKIVQASFDLPAVAQVDLNRLFIGRLSETVGSEPIHDVKHWGNLLHGAITPWIRTARDVVRLSNAVALAWPSVKGEVDLADFVAIETMRLFEPRLFNFVRAHRDDLTDAEPQHLDRERREAFGQELLDSASANNRGQAKIALCYLFPRLDAIFNRTWRQCDWRQFERNRFVASKRRFETYFSLGLADGQVSQAEIEALQASYDNPEETRRIVRSYVETIRRNGGTKAGVLLGMLVSRAESTEPAQAERTARALLAAGDLFVNPIDGWRTPEDFPVRWAVSFAIEPLLEKLPVDRRFSLIAEAIDGPSPTTATAVVYELSSEHGRTSKKQNQETSPSMPIADVLELEKRLCVRLTQDAMNDEILRGFDNSSLLWNWARLAGVETVRAWVGERLDKPGFAIQLMSALTSEGKVHSSGDLVSQPTFSVDRDFAEKIADVDRLAAIARDLRGNGTDDQNVAANFLEGLDRKR